MSADKSSCSRFKRCTSVEGSAPKSYRCPAGEKFDSRLNVCMEASLASCAGEDKPETGNEPSAEEASPEFFREQQGVYPCKEEGAVAFEFDCKHFYNCAKAAGGAQLKGELLKCPEGSEFSESSKKCAAASGAGSKCQKLPPNPLLFKASPMIGEAKEAGGEFKL